MNAHIQGEARRWCVVFLFAVAMAWVEAAVVFYLRTLVGRLDPYQPQPLPVAAGLGAAELVREAATLVMLATVGWLAGRTWRSRLAYAVMAFGVWDIFYYVFLRPLTAWPRSLLDWDILFLLPLPWWGPVLAPVLVAVLMIIGGSLMAFHDSPERPFWPRGLLLALNVVGSLLALYVFMADAIRVVRAGGSEDALRNLLPVRFNWPLFGLAWALMAAPVVELAAKAVRQRGQRKPGRLNVER
jgi:hypothetical protein